ncbi:MAG TPA: FUSC family protein [Acidimicrobiales bacterium]|nr:FUSC family protein [Acidimicrobiales bacterium]
MVREGSARDVVQLAMRVDRTQIRPLIGIEAACSIAVPLTIGLIVNRPTAGAWAAVGAFLTSFSLFQPGFRIRPRVVAVASVVVGLAVFLGAITGIHDPGIYPVVAAWTFLGGLLVAVGPNAALVGVVSSVGLMVASSLNASPSLAFEDGGLALCGGLGAAILVFAFHRNGQRAEARALAAAYRTLAAYAAGIGAGTDTLPEAEPFETLAATLAVPGPHRYLDRADRDRALAVQSEQLRNSLASLCEARGRLTRASSTRPGATDIIEGIDQAAQAISGRLEGIADSCAADRLLAPAASSDPRPVDPEAGSDLEADSEVGLENVGQIPITARETPVRAQATIEPDVRADVNDHLDDIRAHLRTARTLFDGPTPLGSPNGDTPPAGARHGTPGTQPRRAAADQQGPLAGAALALRANLSLQSTAFRHALRLAGVSTLATVLYRIIDPVDGYWIVVAVIFVLKPEFGVTVGRSLLRVVGTLAGVAAATFLLASLQPGPVVLAVLTVVVSVFAFTLFNANYGLFALFLTCLTVFLAAFLGLPPMTAVLNRATDNLIGSGLTVVAFLIWPTWVATEVPRLVAVCLLAEGRLGQRVVAAFSDPRHGSDEDFDQLISGARLSRSNAEAAVERMLHEPHGSDKGTLALSAAEGMLAQMHRFGMASLALLHHVRGPAHDGLAALAPLQHQFETSFVALARSVETDADSPPSGLGPVRQQVHDGLDPGQLQSIIVNETDLMVDVVDTTIDIYNGSRSKG